MINNSNLRLIKDENDFFYLAASSYVGDREDQQDSFGYSLKQDQGLVVVADGMGGLESGKIASEIVVDNFINHYNDNFFSEEKIELLIEAAKRADEKVFGIKSKLGKHIKSGSTVVSIIINRKSLVWCSVGDSRAYLFRGGELVQITQDHNYHTVLLEKMNAGILSTTEYENEKSQGEALISFLGIGNLSLIDFSERPIRLIKDDKIILMSDGLYKIVKDSEIARILDNFNNVEEAIQALEMKARKNKKNSGEFRDNTTVALIKIK